MIKFPDYNERKPVITNTDYNEQIFRSRAACYYRVWLYFQSTTQRGKNSFVNGIWKLRFRREDFSPDLFICLLSLLNHRSTMNGSDTPSSDYVSHWRRRQNQGYRLAFLKLLARNDLAIRLFVKPSLFWIKCYILGLF